MNRAVLPTPEHSAPMPAPSSAVAIKVLHPRVHKTIERDLKIMGFFARMLDALPGMKWLSFPDEVNVFGEMMKMQLDLRVEASNLDRFEENFRHRRTVNFPRALTEYTSKQVLVEEYEDAVPLRAFLREGGGPFDERIANLGLEAFLVRSSLHAVDCLYEDEHRICCSSTILCTPICILATSWSRCVSL